MALGFPVLPMKAAIGALPPERDDEHWAYEIKWDGYRTIVFADTAAHRVRVQSSSGRDVTATYPELGGLHESVNAASVILDGEIVVLRPDGRPDFEALQRHAAPVVFQAFDVLAIDGHDTVALPYEQRRALLAEVLDAGSNWSVPAHRVGGGADLLAATDANGLEGVMAKRLGSTYRPGTRTTDWRKVKNRRAIEVVVGGCTAGTGTRSSTFGALLVGRRDATGVLRFAGGVGTGFTQQRLEQLAAELARLRTDRCPFEPVPPATYTRTATWVVPELVARVEITELTNEGYVRHASFVDLVPSGDA